MGSRDTCPVCEEGFDRRIQVIEGGATVNVTDSRTVCFSLSNDRVYVH